MAGEGESRTIYHQCIFYLSLTFLRDGRRYHSHMTSGLELEGKRRIAPLALKTLSAPMLLPMEYVPCLWHEYVPLTNTAPLARTTFVACVPMAYFSTFGAEMVALEVE
eukprot:584578-Ditylum_brightwellii.AAC.1